MLKRIVQMSLISILASAMADSAVADIYFYHPQTTLHLGSNFDPLNMTKVYPPCIDNGDEQPVDGVNSTPVSSDLHFSIRQVHSKRELYSLIKMSASVSGQYEMFSADASVGTESESESSTEALSWVLLINSNFGRYRAKNPQLTKEAAALAKGDLTKFVERCGTEVVLQVTRGVSLAVVFSANSESSYRRDALNASLNADFGGDLWGVQASASFSQETIEAIEHGEISIDVVGSGGAGVPGLAGIISDLKNLQSIGAVKDRLAKYAITLDSNQTAIIEYQTGPLSSLVPDLKTPDFALYNWAIGEMYFTLQDNIYWFQRIQNFLSNSTDFDPADKTLKKAKENYITLRKRIFDIGQAGRDCRDQYELSMRSATLPRVPHRSSPDDVISETNQLSQNILSVIKSGPGDLTALKRSLVSTKGKLTKMIPASGKYNCYFNVDWLDVTQFAAIPEFPFDAPVVWTDPLNASPANFLYARLSGKSIKSVRFVDLNTDHDLLVFQQNGNKFEGMFDVGASINRVDLVVMTSSGRVYKIPALR